MGPLETQLHLLVNALDMSFEAQFMEDFVSIENSGSDNLKSSAVIPPPTVLDRVLKDLFHEGAPLYSLFVQFCLHSLWFGNCNIRAIAVLWIEFVREVRWCWEESQPLPRMPTTGVIDLSTCLVNQKLHMVIVHHFIREMLIGRETIIVFLCHFIVQLAICIEKNRQLTQKFHDGENKDHVSAQVEEAGQVNGDLSHTRMPSEDFDAPLMTEDMHEERLNAVEALGSSFNFSAQLERDILSSDWENDDFEESGEVSTNDAMESLKNNWLPRGRLSERMSEHGNLWRKIWNDAPALRPAKPLLDPNREGEKVLHYSENIATASTAGTNGLYCLRLGHSKPGNLWWLKADGHQNGSTLSYNGFYTKAFARYACLYAFLSFILFFLNLIPFYIDASLQNLRFPPLFLAANPLSVNSEITEDVKWLCVVFEHVEKLLTVAASLHRKFLQAPRLSEVIFSDYYDFYLPTMGTGTVAGNRDMVKLEGDIDQGVEYYKKALYYNWHYADAMYNLGVTYGEMLKFDMINL
ncbi:putative UDP-N-acetylglucosamine--peptide N-acetylglucosaminyltransferase SPINDLY [Camellia lanceoleosa]|uniref:UDP-N-acetylglucosamine--peptide N-acetylglucosaminyltransferase SPINDLY n=1 Tax=Camellia lanceoleosa TaxID=1840588 RepID=A0ACC0FMP4_9ERIC|nr:putative UDP-N-acetylglucosamine--peptide N-acetylglucosaminyltransferase SPINDLY [Camellia lanceoleosa]